MSSLMEEMNTKAIALGIPLGVHLDLTYRCNERCVHCYLDHDDQGEMTFDEVSGLLGQMAEAGVFLLTLSGGEPLLRKDLFAIFEPRARAFLQYQAQDQRHPDPRKRGGETARAGRGKRSNQRLFPSPRGPRRDHQGAGLAGQNHQRDPLPGLAGTEGNNRQRADARQSRRLSRRAEPGRRTGRVIHHRPHHHPAYQRRPLAARAQHPARRSEKGDARPRPGGQRRGVLRAAASRRTKT